MTISPSGANAAASAAMPGEKYPSSFVTRIVRMSGKLYQVDSIDP
jgi:hypothetical protein